MLKIQDTNEDQLRLYYSYIRNLKHLFQLFATEHPCIININKLLTEIEAYHPKLSKEYHQSITTRIDFLIKEAVYNRQKAFFCYFRDGFFFGIPEDRTEEIASILSTPLEHREDLTNVIEYKSIYNYAPIPQVMKKHLKDMSRFMYFEQFFFWLRDYIEKYQKTMTVLMKDPSVLSQEWKQYIAIMAVSTMKNDFLFRELEEEFLEAGGQETWLIDGLEAVPTKLKNISLLNDLIAHQPWKITAEELQRLKASSWNNNELMEAVMIMIQFHKISLIEENLRVRQSIAEKYYSLTGNGNANDSDGCNSNKDNAFNSIVDDGTLAEMFRLVEEVDKEDDDANAEVEANAEEDIEEDSNTNTGDQENNKTSSSDKYTKTGFKQESFQSVDSDKENNKQEVMLCDLMFNKHISPENNKLAYQGPHNEFSCSYVEFNWVDNGIYTLENLHQAGVTCLNEEIQYMISLNCKSNEKSNNLISANPIKRAINNYIESLFGYFHDDYNYANVTKLLDSQIKYTRYITKITCYPKKINLTDLQDMSKMFNHEEILHIILLAAQVKSRVQLTYLAKAFNDVHKLMD